MTVFAEAEQSDVVSPALRESCFPNAPNGGAPELLGDDDTGIRLELRPQLSAPSRRSDRVRIGFISVPSRPFSFVLAILIHLLGLAAAMGTARWLYRPPQMAVQWGGGGGLQIGLAGDASSPLPRAELPAQQGGAPAMPHAVEKPEAADPASDVSPFPSSRTTHVFANAGDEPGADYPIIGLPSQSKMATLAVIKRSGGGVIGSGAASGGRHGSAVAVSAPTGQGGANTHAGLPGALRGKGIPAPDYPSEARRKGQQGVVKVSIEVLPDGSLGDIRVVSDPGYPLLRNAALTATQKLRRYAFTPAYHFGRPTRDRLIIPFHFVLQ